ncbi:MAG: tRNA (adenosine(37)-N6)-threonylcarbamoyltransferase complex ATPase subunit type 1 TsaE [Patescibacteria group bacterium]
MKKIVTHSEQETFDCGLRLGQDCLGGEVFALIGDLGAGKTKLIQGLAAGLGISAPVNSPTFNILKLYTVRGSKRRLCHIDAYRLRSAEDLSALGAAEFFNDPDTVTAVEWADKVKKIWPSRTRIIAIKPLSEQQRQITIA